MESIPDGCFAIEQIDDGKTKKKKLISYHFDVNKTSINRKAFVLLSGCI